MKTETEHTLFIAKDGSEFIKDSSENESGELSEKFNSQASVPDNWESLSD